MQRESITINNYTGLSTEQFNSLTQKLNDMALKQDQLDASIQELKDASDAIAAKLQAEIDANADNISQESLNNLQSVADQLKAMGTDPANPLAIAK